MTIMDIYRQIDKFAPFRFQEKWDNSGILIGDENSYVTKALLALDVTPAVIDEAEKFGAELIITHHPIIFDGIKSIKQDSLHYRLINSGIGVISAHTNLDVAERGVNTALAEMLSLKNVRPLTTVKKIKDYILRVHVPLSHTIELLDAITTAGAGTVGNYENCSYITEGGISRFTPKEGANPFIGSIGIEENMVEDCIELLCPPENLEAVITALKQNHPYETPSYHIIENHSYSRDIPLGLVGDLEFPTTACELAESIAKALNTSCVKVTNPVKEVTRVAVCGGAGGSLTELAIKAKADIYISSEFKHNQFVDSLNNGIALIDAGHYATEQLVLNYLLEDLYLHCEDVAFTVSKTGDPCLYL